MLVAVLAGCGVPAPAPPEVVIPPAGFGWNQSGFEYGGKIWYARDAGEPSFAGGNLWNAAGATPTPEGIVLAMTQDEGKQWAAEIATALPQVNTSFEVEIEGPIGALDTHVVLGVFLYRHDRSEVDVEFGRWGDQWGHNTQFAIHPGGDAYPRKFSIPVDTRSAVIRMCWLADKLGIFLDTDRGKRFGWVYEGRGRPEQLPHHLHINVWKKDKRPARALPAFRVVRVDWIGEEVDCFAM